MGRSARSATRRGCAGRAWPRNRCGESRARRENSIHSHQLWIFYRWSTGRGGVVGWSECAASCAVLVSIAITGGGRATNGSHPPGDAGGTGQPHFENAAATTAPAAFVQPNVLAARGPESQLGHGPLRRARVVAWTAARRGARCD